MTRMHDDEVHTDAALVAGLVAAQFPEWASLPVEPVASTGTDNAIYRLGDELSVRMPRIHWAVAPVEREFAWLPRIAPHLPFDVPTPVALGAPGQGYPWYTERHPPLAANARHVIAELVAERRARTSA